MSDLSHYNSLDIAIISDTHMVLDERIADVIKDCDIAIHAGDICCATVLEKMHPRLGQIFAVTGNNDSIHTWHEDHKEVVENLPDVATIKLPGGILAVEHGHEHGHHQPDHESLRKAHPDARVIVYGHTHKQVCDTDGTPWVINPGAAGATRTRGGPSCLILTVSKDRDWTVEALRFSEEIA